MHHSGARDDHEARVLLTDIQHDFRRTAVRNLTRNSVTGQVAMQISGHRTRSVFDRYDIVSTTDLQEAARRIGAATAV